MAKLLSAPSDAVIVANRGKVDFYQWKGIWVARAWPKSSFPRARSAAEQLNVTKFVAAAKITSGVSPETRDAYATLTGQDVGITWIDMQRSVTVGGAKFWRNGNGS